MTTVYRTERVYRRKPSENLRRLFRSARAAQRVTDKPLTCVNALLPHLRQENNIRHEGRYRHVEKTFSSSDLDLHRSHRAATGIRSATAATFFLARCFCGHGCHHWGPRSRMWGDPSHSALQILNERFARGEIQKDEYAEKKAAILSGG